MTQHREQHLAGLDCLQAATALLQRRRVAHPTAGLFEAADLQWWWRSPRSTDVVPQLFWFDGEDRPVAAAIATDWGDGIALDTHLLSDAEPDWIAHVVNRGLDHAAEIGFAAVEFEVDRDDAVVRDVVVGRGFEVKEEGLVEAWLAAADRPDLSWLPQGYRLASRLELGGDPHHMIGRNGSDVERRLRETSLYRPDLDLVVVDSAGEPAGYGLFWFDPVSNTGLVEPMRTHDDHQRRGLARHILTAGLERLAGSGAERIKLCYEPDNPGSGHLYRSVGFVPGRQTDIYAGPTGDR